MINSCYYKNKNGEFNIWKSTLELSFNNGSDSYETENNMNINFHNN